MGTRSNPPSTLLQGLEISDDEDLEDEDDEEEDLEDEIDVN